jgi:hypothetical protein
MAFRGSRVRVCLSRPTVSLSENWLGPNTKQKGPTRVEGPVALSASVLALCGRNPRVRPRPLLQIRLFVTEAQTNLTGVSGYSLSEKLKMQGKEGEDLARLVLPLHC